MFALLAACDDREDALMAVALGTLSIVNALTLYAWVHAIRAMRAARGDSDIARGAYEKALEELRHDHT